MSVIMQMPKGAKEIISTLQNAGYQAYAVGGCVRDTLLFKKPLDFDICTSALPEEVKKCFAGMRVLDTGIKHGTVSVIRYGKAYEVTTFRVEGGYRDSRHPDHVVFVRSLKEDLARRDFTINAMAYHDQEGFIDYYGGKEDLKAKIIRCVGVPKERFSEDALRIMRAIRLAGTLGFSIEPETKQAIFDMKEQLSHIAAERIKIELNHILLSGHVKQVLFEYLPVLAVVIPNLYHVIHDNNAFDIAGLVAIVPSQIELRLAALCYAFLSYGCRPDVEIRQLLYRLTYEKNVIKDVVGLLTHVGAPVCVKREFVLKMLNQLGEKQFRMLLALQKGVMMIKDKSVISILQKEEKCLVQLLEEGACYSLKQLAIGGADLMAMGYPKGKQIGIILQKLLLRVIEGKLPNEKHALRKEAMRMQG